MEAIFAFGNAVYLYICTGLQLYKNEMSEIYFSSVSARSPYGLNMTEKEVPESVPYSGRV